MPLTATMQQTLRLASAMGLGAAELSAIVSVVLPDRLEAFRQRAREQEEAKG